MPLVAMPRTASPARGDQPLEDFNERVFDSGHVPTRGEWPLEDFNLKELAQVERE